MLLQICCLKYEQTGGQNCPQHDVNFDSSDNCATQVSNYFGAKTTCTENDGRRDLAILVDVSGKTNRKTDVFEFVKKIGQSIDLASVKLSLTTFANSDEEVIFSAKFVSAAEIDSSVDGLKWGGDKV